MNETIIQQVIAENAPEVEFKQGHQFPEFTISPANLHQTAQALKTNESTLFDFLYCQTGVDLNGKLGVVYHLRSTNLKHACVLKVFTSDRENTAVDTVCDIWPTAEFHEREIFDLLGIKFNNHPDLRRLFLEETFEGYPLRKDFNDDINIIQK